MNFLSRLRSLEARMAKIARAEQESFPDNRPPTVMARARKMIDALRSETLKRESPDLDQMMARLDAYIVGYSRGESLFGEALARWFLYRMHVLRKKAGETYGKEANERPIELAYRYAGLMAANAQMKHAALESAFWYEQLARITTQPWPWGGAEAEAVAVNVVEKVDAEFGRVLAGNGDKQGVST